jgi:ATP-dependent DNA helicase RecG
MNFSELKKIVSKGETDRVEFKRTTGELKDALQTICAFLNAKGGTVFFGVNRKGIIEGQQVSEQTIHEVTAGFGKFEPSANIRLERIQAKPGWEVIALTVDSSHESVPFAFDGRAYERVGNTTRKMPQGRYEKLLLDRSHAKRLWENQPAFQVTLNELDRGEIFRTRDLAIQQNRISVDTGRDAGEILDRLNLRVGGVVTQAAQVLYGTQFLPYYPQCMLKMGRFRGTSITGEIVDNRQEHLNAFAAVREGMSFLERTMPLGARFPKGKIFREDRFPIPLDALREILLNAVMHRDYSNASGHVAIAIFDDRVEIRSCGRLPSGITIAQLSGPHTSKPRNPLISEAFHRTGAVEIWGRGTNRVIEACRRHGAKPPKFEELSGYVYVTFKAQMVAGTGRDSVAVGDIAGSEKSSVKGSEKSSEKILAILAANPGTGAGEIAKSLGISQRAVEKQLAALKTAKRLRRIGPDKGGLWKVIKQKRNQGLRITGISRGKN